MTMPRVSGPGASWRLYRLAGTLGAERVHPCHSLGQQRGQRARLLDGQVVVIACDVTAADPRPDLKVADLFVTLLAPRPPRRNARKSISAPRLWAQGP